MIRRGTWILLVVLLAVAGAAYYLSDRQANELAAATPTKGTELLIETSGSAPSLIKIENNLGVVVEFGRDDSGNWTVLQPREAAADQAAAEAAATQVGALQVLSTVNLAADIVGLDEPEYSITITSGNSSEHILKIGAETPIQDGYYAQLDDQPFKVIEKSGVDALVGLVTAPPYLETPTPVTSATAMASETPLSGAGSGGTPTPVASLEPSTEPTRTP